jgi:serine/arginine repetitive matrix protein 2
MQALLEHSVQSYRSLSSDLCSRHVKTSSRTSPYPQSRGSKITISPDQTRPTNVEEVPKALATPVLQEVKVNSKAKSSTVPSLEAIKPFSPMFLDDEPKRENAYGLAPAARFRVPSNSRRTALGWSKCSTGGESSTDQKENVVGQGAVKMFIPFFLVSYFIFLQSLII